MKTPHAARRIPAGLAALAVAATLVACGADTEAEPAGPARSTIGNGVDRAFVADMAPHHRSAIAMAEIAREQGQSRFVRNLAADIIEAQEEEIAVLIGADAELAEAGVRTGSLRVPAHGMGMDDDPAMLRGARPFDRAFVDMMVPHHQGAVRMARDELARGQSSELKGLAKDIVKAQRREIAQMEAFREKTFGGPVPTGRGNRPHGG